MPPVKEGEFKTPFDVEGVNGTWKKLKGSDNLREILQIMNGMCLMEMVDTIMGAEFVVGNKRSGNSITLSMSMMGMTASNTYTLGQECEETDPTGNKRKAIATLEGDAMVLKHPNYDGKGTQSCQKFRLSNDGKALHTEYKIGGMEGWSISNKV